MHFIYLREALSNEQRAGRSNLNKGRDQAKNHVVSIDTHAPPCKMRRICRECYLTGRGAAQVPAADRSRLVVKLLTQPLPPTARCQVFSNHDRQHAKDAVCYAIHALRSH